MEELFYMLNAVYPLPDDLRDHLFEIVTLKDFSKGEFLLKAGQVCQNVYFVRSGLLRCFVKDKQEKEINTWFMKQADVVYSILSFLDQTPSSEYIQALKDTSVFYISHRQLVETYDKFQTFNINGRKLTEEYYKRSAQREKIMRMYEPIDRYNYLIEHFPELMNDVPDKHLATFIRMSHVTLSRLRNKRMRKK
jgi:CRP/FNR family transcriptional regulator, anaerobic regulatory protein